MRHPYAVWVVRWHQAGGKPTHRTYLTEWGAYALAERLRSYGIDAEVWTAGTPRWRQDTP